MDNGTMTVWFPHAVDKVTGEMICGLGYYGNRWDAVDVARDYEINAIRKGYNNVSVKVITREVPESEGRFWISTNRF